MGLRRRRRGAPREEVVNTLLAQELRRQGLPAVAERRSGDLFPDVRIELRDGGVILLEGKWESTAGQLEGQLEARLAQFPEALAVVGVVHPEGLRVVEDVAEALGEETGLRWRMYGSRGAVTPDRLELRGSVVALADYLRLLPMELEGADRVAAATEVVRYALEQAVGPLRGHQRIAVRVAGIIAEADKESDRLAALQIGCLALFNALAFQERLAGGNPAVATVREAWQGGMDGIVGVWQGICEEIDYVPVFEIAGQIAEALKDGPDELQAGVVEPLLRAVMDTRLVEGHDLSGRLFHTLLTDAKFTGAYYTSVPSATLLARLVFEGWPAGVDWGDHEFPGSLNVADLACGTGTLLMAVAAEAQRRHEAAGGRNAPALHKAMVEQAIHGYDVQLSAIHFAATSLAMLNPEIQFDRMNLYVMPLGADDSGVWLGSLEFLTEPAATVQHALSPETLGVREEEVSGVSGDGMEGAGRAVLPNLDLAIMNPPFTRSVGGNLLFGNRPPGDRRRLRRELARRLRELQASSTAGLGAAFVAAVAPRLRPGEGRLALVLPATVCTGASWEQTRALIEQEFVLDMVVTSHDPQRWNFSDSTDLSEVLIIATRRRAEGQVSNNGWGTKFVNMWRNPAGMYDAHRMAAAISATRPVRLEAAASAVIRDGGQALGEIIAMPETILESNRWLAVQFARMDVFRAAVRLLNNSVVTLPGARPSRLRAPAVIPMCRLDELGEIGPDVRDLRDAFDSVSYETPFPMVENHETNYRRGLAAEVNRYLEPLELGRAGRRLKSAESLWAKAGQLLIAERLNLNAARVLAMCADQDVLSNVWWPVATGDRDWDKALALWFNSSPGILAYLASRNTTQGGWIRMRKGDLSALRVLDVRALAGGQLAAMGGLFDELAGREFRRLPDMWDCEARRALDDGLSGILGLPDLRSLRRMLAVEPVVSNRRVV